MDKILPALFELVLKNKSSTPLFAIFAGLIAFWAITGGASGLFGAPALKELETNSLAYKTKLEVCLKQDEALKVERTNLREQVSHLKTLNEMLRLVLAIQSPGKLPVLDSLEKTLPTTPVEPQTKPQSPP